MPDMPVRSTPPADPAPFVAEPPDIDDEPGQEVTWLPFEGTAVSSADVDALHELAAAGWGEGDHQDPHVPPSLLELHVAIEARDAGMLPGGDV
jgi:hypothetical protein